jgi:hypothetical protein
VVAAWNNFLGGCRVAAVLWQVERDAVMTAVIDTVMTVGRAYTAEEKTAWQRAVIRGVFTRLGREEESHQQ